MLFAREIGIKVLHVPFKGAGPAVTAMLGGETDLLFANTGVFLGHIKSGKLRPLGVAAMTRLALLPDVPTLNESGFPGFESSTYYGLLAPAGTPRPIINKLHGELVKIYTSGSFLDRFEVMVGAQMRILSIIGKKPAKVAFESLPGFVTDENAPFSPD